MKLKVKWLQVAVYGTLGFCLALTAAVVIIASLRRSGSTGIDTAEIQRIRYEASHKEKIR